MSFHILGYQWRLKQPSIGIRDLPTQTPTMTRKIYVVEIEEENTLFPGEPEKGIKTSTYGAAKCSSPVHITTQQRHRETLSCTASPWRCAILLPYNFSTMWISLAFKKQIPKCCFMFDLYCTFKFFHCDGCVKTLVASITLQCHNGSDREVFKCFVTIKYSEDV